MQVIYYFLYLYSIFCLRNTIFSDQNAVDRSVLGQDSEMQLSGNGIIAKNGRATLNIKVEIRPVGGAPPLGIGARRPGGGMRRPQGAIRPPRIGGRRPGLGGRRPVFGGRRPGAGAGGPGAEEEGPGAEEEGPGAGPGGESITFFIVLRVFTNSSML